MAEALLHQASCGNGNNALQQCAGKGRTGMGAMPSPDTGAAREEPMDAPGTGTGAQGWTRTGQPSPAPGHQLSTELLESRNPGDCETVGVPSQERISSNFATAS